MARKRPDELAFDMNAEPTLYLPATDTDDGSRVCEFRWWGPTEDWDVVGEVCRHERSLYVRTLRLVPHWDDIEGLRRSEEPPPPYRPVTPALLRKIPLARLLAQTHQRLLQVEFAPEGIAPTPQWLTHVQNVEEASRTTTGRGPGRPRISDEELRRVAEAYLEEDVHGRGITQRLADRFGLQPATMRDRIAAARARGFLSPASAGQRGAAPGWRLMGTTYDPRLLPPTEEPR
jgi:transposase-like protein